MKKKKVKIQTPPHSPEEVPRRLSAGRVSPPPPATSYDDDESSDSTTTADSDLEQALRNTRRNSGSLPPPPNLTTSATGAPPNPFARTLATNEAGFGLQRARDTEQGSDGQNGEAGSRPGGSRPALDVDQFKNILMTGSAVPSPPAAGVQQQLPGSSSNTDISSASRQSLFDPHFEINQETPRTSFDDMDSPSESEDTEESSSLMSGTERLDDFAPPAPPKHSKAPPTFQKGPQTVSFAEFDESITSGTSSSGNRAPPSAMRLGGDIKPIRRVASDLNKPLPAPPQESERPPETQPQEVTTGDDISQTKKAPPPPPASRRAMQSAMAQTRPRGSSETTQESIQEEASSSPAKPVESTSKSAAPPPPPSRKSKPTSQVPTPATETPPDAQSPLPISGDPKNMPPPPPRRNASKAGNTVNRTPSNASRSSVSRKEGNATSNQHPPPPPPTRRGKLDSTEGPVRRPSEDIRRSSNDESGRSTSQSSLQEVTEPAENGTPTGDATEQEASTDILADMSAFQAEIDALRARSERPG